MAGMFDIQGPTNMVSSYLTPKSDYLTPTQPYTSPFAGTSLGTPYTSAMFGTPTDYSSVFNKAALTPQVHGDVDRGPWTLPRGPWSGSRPSSGGGTSYSAGPSFGGSLPPIEFSLGPAPELQPLNIDWEQMGQRAMQANAPFRQQFQQMTPGLEAGIKSSLATAQQQLAGQVPADVAQQIARSSAAAGLRGGYAGGGIGRNLTARDFGLTSLDLQKAGSDLLARSSALAQQAMQAQAPISPSMVFGEALSQASANQQLANQNLLNAWQGQPLPGQYVLGKGFQSFTPGQYLSSRPTDPRMAGIGLGRPGSAQRGIQERALTNWSGKLV